jgi:hypothetical protein
MLTSLVLLLGICHPAGPPPDLSQAASLPDLCRASPPSPVFFDAARSFREEDPAGEAEEGTEDEEPAWFSIGRVGDPDSPVSRIACLTLPRLPAPCPRHGSPRSPPGP